MRRPSGAVAGLLVYVAPFFIWSRSCRGSFVSFYMLPIWPGSFYMFRVPLLHMLRAGPGAAASLYGSPGPAAAVHLLPDQLPPVLFYYIGPRFRSAAGSLLGLLYLSILYHDKSRRASRKIPRFTPEIKLFSNFFTLKSQRFRAFSTPPPKKSC